MKDARCCEDLAGWGIGVTEWVFLLEHDINSYLLRL